MEKIFTNAKQRILQIPENKGLGKEKFFEKIGATWGNFKGRAKESSVSADIMANILTEYPDINPDWLITGKGTMYRAAETPVQSGIPLISVEAAAGFSSLSFTISEEDIQARYVVPDFSDIDFMMRVKGSSMYPKYSSGDIVACRIIRESKFIQWNKAYVVATTEQGILCKRLKQSAKKDCLLAVSDNKEYEPFDLPKSEITGIALVVGVIRLE